jgi:hydrogenase expression/formation protein HypC
MCLGVPGKIESISTGASGDPLQRKARVSFGGTLQEVHLSFVPEAQVGDYVIVHVGVALSRLDEAEALRTLNFFADLEREGLEAKEPLS